MSVSGVPAKPALARACTRKSIDAFVDKLELSELGFDGVAPEATGLEIPAQLLALTDEVIE
jgi:hypothetical protein